MRYDLRHANERHEATRLQRLRRAGASASSYFISHILYFIFYISGFAALSSCNRYEIESYYTGKADVRVNIDWETRFGEKPSGMTIMLAKDSTDDIIFTDVTNFVDNYDLQLEPGTYRMLIFNLSSGEYGSMRFFQMKNFTEAYAYAEQLQRTTSFWDVNVSYMREPEYIGCVVDTFTILPEMTDGKFRFVNWRDKIEGNYEELVLNEVVEPMVTTLFVRVKVIGYKYMTHVIGNISGMANGFLLTQGWRREQTGYHLLDNWSSMPSADPADTIRSVGYLTTKISCYGLPHGRELISQRDSMSNMLSLMFTLIDDRQMVFRYPVGKHIRYRNADENGYFSRHDVTLDLELLLEAPFFTDDEVPNLPYSQPTGTGAFDAEVAPWGDEENIDIPC